LGATESGSWFDFLHLGPGWDLIPMTWIVIGFLVVVSAIGTRRLSLRPHGLQNMLEYTVSSLRGLCREVIGPRGDDFVPLVGSMFIFILVMNLFGLIPGMKAPTENWSTTAALAIVVFILTQFYGFWVGGWRYFLHFLGEPIWLAPLMLPLHIISEFARPLSLSLRLFANIYAKETLIVVLTGLSVPALHLLKIGKLWVGLPIPTALPVMLLAILMGLIQAFVFALLTAIYLAGAVSGHEELEAHA
jgi:F-type H+-transporting ATPase subunit a